MANDKDMEKFGQIYRSTISSLDSVLIGQDKVKKVITASLLCDTNSRILLTGNTGTGKTTLSNFLANSFLSERITVTSDMIPSDIQEQLKNKQKMKFLQIDEFNRASGKVQSALIELLAEKQISVGGSKYQFDDFYVFATQNSADIAGIFNVPQAVYDRFDVNVYFEDLSEDEKRRLLFSDFVPSTTSTIMPDDLAFTKNAVAHFETNEQDERIMMQIFNLIDHMTLYEHKLFAGSNIRAHKFALKLAKLAALSSGRNYLLPADMADFIQYVYMHRIDQNVARINAPEVKNRFDNVKQEILTLKRYKF